MKLKPVGLALFAALFLSGAVLMLPALSEAQTQQTKEQQQTASTAGEKGAGQGQKAGPAEPWSVHLREWAAKALVRIGKGALWLLVILAICIAASKTINWWLFGMTGGLSRLLRRFDLNADMVETLRSLSRSAISYLIFFIGLIVFLGKVGVSTVALTAGLAGMAGIAIGFGSQGIVRDFVSGAFVLLERHYGLGDFVEVAGAAGFVERITIRTTTIRQVNGEVRCVPNGSIGSIRRFPKGYIDARVDVFLKAASDTDNASKLLDKVGAQLAGEIDVLLEAPVLLCTRTGETDMPYLRYRVRTLPMQEWVAKNEFAPRAKQVLTDAGIALRLLPRVTFLTDVEVLERRLLSFKEHLGAARKE